MIRYICFSIYERNPFSSDKTGMKKVLSLLKPHKWWLLLSILFATVNTVMQLLLPAYTKNIQSAILAYDMKGIWKYAGLMLVFTLIGIVTSVMNTLASTKTSVGYSISLRNFIFDKVSHLSQSDIDKIGVSSLVTRTTNDVRQIHDIVLSTLKSLIPIPIMLVGGLVMAFRMNAEVAKTSLQAIPMLAVVAVILLAIIIPVYSKVQKLMDRINQVMREKISGIRVIRAFNRTEYEDDRFSDANKRLTGLSLVAGRIMAGLMPIITLFFYGLICVIVAKSINSVSTLDIVKDRQTIVDTIPNLTAFIAYFSLILTSILSVVSIIVSIPRAVISGKRIKEIMVAVSDIQPPENPIEPKAGDIGKVEFRDVSFKYKPRPAGKKKRRAPAPKKRPVKTDKKPEAIAAAPGAAPDDAGIAADGARTEIPVPAEKAAKAPAEEKKKEKVFELKHVSFVSNPGEVTAIIGVTGSGKTTLMNLIPRLYDCTEGEVLVNGVNVKDLAPQTLADAIAVVPQQAFLFSGTVADNIRYGNQDATETDIWRALEIAQAKSFVAAMPDGIDSFVSQAGKNYSGGQKQRLAIARAIVKRAPIILFDDSFSALDLATDARLRASLKENLTDTNLIIVAQRVGTVLNADRIIVLEDGNVMGVGTHRELLENCDVYREIVVTQLSEDALSELPGGAADNSGKEDADDGENEE